MKTVFSTRQCVHVWAQQSQEKGRSSKGSIFFQDKTIWSYGTHFPMAHFWNDETVIINSDSYSSTTQKHMSYVRQAVNHKNRLYVPTEVIKALLWSDDDSAKLHAANCMVSHALKQANSYIYSAAKRSKLENRMADLSSAVNELKAVKTFYDTINVIDAIPDSVNLLLKSLAENANELMAQHGATIKAQRLETSKRKKEAEQSRLLILNDARLKWKAGKELDWQEKQAIRSNKSALLRIKGIDDLIETSQGAEFPISHAIKAFEFIRQRKEKAEPWETNGHSIHLGNFKIDKIDMHGNVKAGCHYVEWHEIEALAIHLKIYP